jgi:hypothetical protein
MLGTATQIIESFRLTFLNDRKISSFHIAHRSPKSSITCYGHIDDINEILREELVIVPASRQTTHTIYIICPILCQFQQ